MKTLGVTGGIGSGKTTVCEMFETLGAEVFYADTEARRLMTEDVPLREALVDAFGASTFDAAGLLDRVYLALEVFGDPAKLARLNGLVHPRVREALVVRKADARARGISLFVYEAALLYETGGEAYVDAVAVVVAPERERIERVRRRDGLDASQVRARMNHQGSPASARARADFVIENDGDLAHLRRQVEAVYQQLIQHEEARGASPPGPSAPTSPF